MENYKQSVAVYLRKSRMDPDAETVEETLSRHEDTLKQFAEKSELNITHIYREVVSGDGLFTRPQMLELLKDIEDNKYTAVLCVEIDRLGRSSQRDSGIIFETFQEHNIFIITPGQTYDLNNEYQSQSVELQSFIARQELKSIKRRMQTGIKKTLENGGHVCEPPYGYRRTYINKIPTLEIYEPEAEIIRMVFDMYVNQGYGSHIIADRLNTAGYTPRKNNHFTRNTIRFYLENPVYTGKIIWNRKHRKKRKTFSDKNVYIPNPENEWIVSNGIHPAIISQEIFDKAQEIRKTRTHPPSFTGALKNPFAGLIYCAHCGDKMQRQCGSKGIRLLCANNGCNRSIKLEYVEETILDILKDILHHINIGDIGEYSSSSDERASVDMLKLRITSIQSELKKLYEQKNKLHDLLEQGIYDIPTFTERSKIVSNKITAAEKQQTEANEALSAVCAKPHITEAAPAISDLIENYDTLTPAEKNKIYKSLIEKITYSRTEEHPKKTFDINISWKYDF